MKAYLGTSGFSYAEWKGSFYPTKLKNAAMLSYYATQLPSVEINNTFYRLPRASVLEGWHAQVNDDFRFAVKASRRITHFRKLAGAEDLLDYLFSGLASLGNCLGPVLFQLPPTMKADAALLDTFLSALPQKIHDVPVRAALEFRHASWFSDDIYSVLEKNGAALVGGDLDEDEKSPPLIRTAEFSYLRLRKTAYSEAELDGWAEKIQALNVDQIFGYFKHEEIGPQLAAELKNRLES